MLAISTEQQSVWNRYNPTEDQATCTIKGEKLALSQTSQTIGKR